MILSTFMISSLWLAQGPTPFQAAPVPAIERQDLCPSIPAATLNGCPNIRPYTGTKPKLKTAALKILKPENLVIQEQTQIKRGDIFKAVILDPITLSILAESNSIKTFY